MSEPFIGEIRMFGGNFAPRGYAFCDGQLLSIAQNSALFSLLGTIYGGDGRTNFGLPDLRGRIPLHQGNGPGLTDRRIGQRGGALIESELQSTQSNSIRLAIAYKNGRRKLLFSGSGSSLSVGHRALGTSIKIRRFLENTF